MATLNGYEYLPRMMEEYGNHPGLGFRPYYYRQDTSSPHLLGKGRHSSRKLVSRVHPHNQTLHPPLHFQSERVDTAADVRQ